MAYHDLLNVCYSAQEIFEMSKEHVAERLHNRWRETIEGHWPDGMSFQVRVKLADAALTNAKA